MQNHKYILEPYKGMNIRYHCPDCQQRDKTFSLYIDTETGEHIHPSVGRCNRESNCGYHYAPKQYFQDNLAISGNTPQTKAYKPRPVTLQPKPVSFIPVEVFKASLKAHETNHFVQFLINLFGVEVASELISRYFIATSKHWNGATVFWQIDIQGKVRTGKIMLYNPTTGKRVKNLELPVYWVHKAINSFVQLHYTSFAVKPFASRLGIPLPVTKHNTWECTSLSQADATILTGFHFASLRHSFTSVAFSPTAAK